MAKPAADPSVTATKLVVRVLQDLVARDRFDTYADLAEALKVRCARLKIPYHAGLISDAIDQVERGGKTPLILRPTPRRPIERVDEPPPSHEEAIATLRRLGWPG